MSIKLSKQPITEHKGDDPFCRKEVIEKQRVLEGNTIDVLYNYAPVSRHHFLVIPKKHRQNFDSLTEEEYLEAMKITKRLLDYFNKKGYTNVHLFHKKGFEAGQTVFHWHQHVIISKSKSDNYIGYYNILKKMILRERPLSQKKLETIVHDYRKEFSFLNLNQSNIQ